ncbi:transposase [Kordia antarctica]|uniref:transposase n=1 Tax=Kordia antarctica TaxID=1218801 RepID=UPI001D1591A6|nr:transposase [Kordia antarctica]
MSEKFKNKYRIQSTRLQYWNYGRNAAYFVTICTKNRTHFFGQIISGTMILSETGKIANQNWLTIPKQFPYVKLGDHIVMPNHVHGIIIIDKNDDDPVEARLIALPQDHSHKKSGGFAGNKNPMLNNNLSRIIRWYKGRTTFECRKIDSDFEWQSRFHDHIIRNEKSFSNISNYIINNPANWKEDKFHKTLL